MDKWLYFRVMTVVEFQAKQLKVAYASKLDDHKRTRNLILNPKIVIFLEHYTQYYD